MSVATGAGRIRVLPEGVASRIAAGEVVERPAAVVKELIENSLDAGSTTIFVDVIDGGRKAIKVTDDGEGIAPADVPVAFQRHATSKLRHESDLLTVETMGFRGEALPSIASVSRIRMLTASRQDQVGTLLVMAGGTVGTLQEAAAAPGTQIEVSDLFFNTPARKKFLKATATELSHVCHTVQEMALAWPSVHVRLVHNGQKVFEYPSVASRHDRLLQVYGAAWLDQMATVRSDDDPNMTVEGLVIKPVYGRSSRSPQELFVNRRPVRNGTVSHAVYDAYGATMSKGQHPQFVLFVDVSRSSVDVNVHPTKREVRFADPERIHRAVHRAVRHAIGLTGSNPVVPAIQWPRRSEGDGPALASGVESAVPLVSRGAAAIPADMVREAVTPYLTPPAGDVIPFGQVRHTFLVAQVGAELQVIDQHTAHERVLFERLCRAAATETVASQRLLIPEPLDLPPHTAALLEEHLADLARIGLELEPFGSGSLLIRSVPAVTGTLDYRALVQDLLEDLAQWSTLSAFDQRLRPMLATVACHSAVRAGRPLMLPEMAALITDWVTEGMPTTCPHGRRIALRLPVEELDKIFNRA